MQKPHKQANKPMPTKQNSLTLKGWVFNKDGEQMKDLVKTSFAEFYLAKRIAKSTQNTEEIRKNHKEQLDDDPL